MWNIAISLVCGNTHIWKGAESASLLTVAVQRIVASVLEANGVPGGVATLCQGAGNTVGEALINDSRLPLVSFTGSTKIGRHVSEKVHR